MGRYKRTPVMEPGAELAFSNNLYNKLMTGYKELNKVGHARELTNIINTHTILERAEGGTEEKFGVRINSLVDNFIACFYDINLDEFHKDPELVEHIRFRISIINELIEMIMTAELDLDPYILNVEKYFELSRKCLQSIPTNTTLSTSSIFSNEP